MKNRQIIALIFSIVTIQLLGQTKMISHKSHSGSSKNFKTVIEKKLFNIRSSNFGGAPLRSRVEEPQLELATKTPLDSVVFIELATKAQLDSVIFISDTVAVMVTSNYRYCKENERSIDISTLWKPGRDTVYNHPLFSKRNAVDSIKAILKKDYLFRNSIDSVKFVGYSVPKNRPELKVDAYNIPISLLGRRINKQKEINVQNNIVKFYVWDKDEEDGDTISLNINGKWVLEKYKLTKQKKSIEIDFARNSSNYLILYAHNLGRIPPNTIAISIYDGNEKYINLKSDMKTCGAVNIHCIPKTKESSVPYSGIKDPHQRPPFNQLLWLFGIIVFFFFHTRFRCLRIQFIET